MNELRQKSEGLGGRTVRRGALGETAGYGRSGADDSRLMIAGGLYSVNRLPIGISIRMESLSKEETETQENPRTLDEPKAKSAPPKPRLHTKGLPPATGAW